MLSILRALVQCKVITVARHERWKEVIMENHSICHMKGCLLVPNNLHFHSIVEEHTLSSLSYHNILEQIVLSDTTAADS